MNDGLVPADQSGDAARVELNVAFWNLQNLFDPDVSPIAAELDFTPVCGWDRQAFEVKIRNLAEVIRSMFDGRGPDLLGLCEIENERVARRLIRELGRDDYQLAIAENTSAAALDTALIYSDRLFRPETDNICGHIVHLRFPTIDILELHLKVLPTDSDLMVLVNHWPSRRGAAGDSEAFRLTAAAHCRQLIDKHLKLGRREYLELPDSEISLFTLNRIQDRNVLIMGDLNDEPWNRSVCETLGAGFNCSSATDSIRMVRNSLPSYRSYSSRPVWLFNPMWSLAGKPDQGTCSTPGAMHSLAVRDQMILSRGLVSGLQGLKVRHSETGIPQVKVYRPECMTLRNGRPREFRLDQQAGYSDHFPVTTVLELTGPSHHSPDITPRP